MLLFRASDSCLMLDYVHVINFRIVLLLYGPGKKIKLTVVLRQFMLCIDLYCFFVIKLCYVTFYYWRLSNVDVQR